MKKNSAGSIKTLLMRFWNWTIIAATKDSFLDTNHTSLTHHDEEENERRRRDDTTLHNKKYHAKKQFIISFSQVFSISLSFKSTQTQRVYWDYHFAHIEKCFMLWNKSTASIFRRGSLSESQAWCRSVETSSEHSCERLKILLKVQSMGSA